MAQRPFLFYMAVDVPVSVWRTTDGQSDNTYTGLIYIIDTQGDYLVDPQGYYVIDTGIEMPKVPVSVWEENDSI